MVGELVLSAGARRRPPSDHVSRCPGPLGLTFLPRLEALGPVRDQLRSWLAHWTTDELEVGEILVAVGEAATNALESAGPAGDGPPVRLTAHLQDCSPGCRVVIEVRSVGPWLDRPARPERGRGLPIMAALMDEVVIDAAEGSDGSLGAVVVTLTRRLATAPTEATADVQARKAANRASVSASSTA